MKYEAIRVEEKYEGALTEIFLASPPANILTAKMMAELSAQLEADGENPHKKLIVIAGEGKHFSFGASVEEHKPDRVNDMLSGFHRLVGEMLNSKIPTAAKVSGLCLGGSFELALACTFIFADEDAKFAVPEIQLAVFPPVASVLLPFKCGDTFASEMILTGNQFSAQKLYNLGLVNEVVPRGRLADAVSTFFEEQLLPKSAASLRFANLACRSTLAAHYSDSISRLEGLYLNELMSTRDAVEGITAFLEKRKPEWRDE